MYFYFDGVGSTRVTVTQYKATWISDTCTYLIPCKKKAFTNAIKYLLDIFSSVWYKNIQANYRYSYGIRLGAI